MKQNKNEIKTIEPLLNGVEKVVMVIDVVILFFIALIIFVQVIARFMMISMTGTEELAQYAYVIFVFLAWSIAALRGTDVSVMIVFDRFPFKVRQLLQGIYHIIMALFCCVVFKSALVNVTNSAMIPSPNNPWFLMGWLYRGVSVGVAFTVVFNVIRAIRLWLNIDIYVTEKEANLKLLQEALDAEVASDN